MSRKSHNTINKNKITQSDVKKLFNYNPDTGVFIWKEKSLSDFKRIGDFKTWTKMFCGKEAGTISKEDGYRAIKINGNRYRMHRLAWLYCYGYLPENELDHIDRDRANNRIKNLREVSTQCNRRNAGLSKNNTSGVKGVCWNSKLKKWRVRITVSLKELHIGIFNSFSDAVKAMWEAENKYGFLGCNSSSSAYLYLKDKGLI